MKIRYLFLLLFATAVVGRAQNTAPAPPLKTGGKNVMFYRRELGKWWQNSETAKSFNSPTHNWPA